MTETNQGEDADRKALEEAARKRREKILARGAERLKIVSGEQSREVQPETSTPPSKTSETENPTMSPSTARDAEIVTSPVIMKEDRPNWEKKYQKDLATITQKREISEDILSRLDVTQQMAVEAPKAVAETSMPTSATILNGKHTSTSSKFPIKLDSLLTLITMCSIGFLSGLSNGEFVSQNLWLPFGSFVFFALFVHVVLSFSLTRLKLTSQKVDLSSNWWISTAVKFLPPQFSSLIQNVMFTLGLMKESHDDMLVFVFAHGLSSTIQQFV